MIWSQDVFVVLFLTIISLAAWLQGHRRPAAVGSSEIVGAVERPNRPTPVDTAWIPCGAVLRGVRVLSYFGSRLFFLPGNKNNSNLLGISSMRQIKRDNIEGTEVAWFTYSSEQGFWTTLPAYAVYDPHGKPEVVSVGAQYNLQGTILQRIFVATGDPNIFYDPVFNPRDAMLRVYSASPKQDPQQVWADWEQMGQTLVDDWDHDFDRPAYAEAIAMNSNGTVLVVSACLGLESQKGYVDFYHWHTNRDGGGNWNKIQRIVGKTFGGNFGTSLAAAKDIVAVFSMETGFDNEHGSVQCFRFDRLQQAWLEHGQQLRGKDTFDHFGYPMQLSADGNILAIGASQHKPIKDPNATGYVQVFQWKDDRGWEQMGPTIHGSQYDEGFGVQLALSGNGLVLAVAATDYSSKELKWLGRVKVFEWNVTLGEWKSTGTWCGHNAMDFWGESLALSHDGSRLAVGAPQSHFGTGYVQVYDRRA